MDDWLQFGPPPEVTDTAQHELVEELVNARKAADPDQPAARVIRQLTQAETYAYLADSWYTAAGEFIDSVTDTDQADFREEVRKQVAGSADVSRALTGRLERAFSSYSAPPPRRGPHAQVHQQRRRRPGPLRSRH